MKGTLLGFTFNNIHSSSLGLTRINTGNEFQDSLLPEFEDKILSKPGSDGGYYYGTIYNKRTISLTLGFDSLTEKELRTVKKLFGEKQINNLVLDETPYKMYRVRLSGTPSLSYSSFSNDYESKGSLQFYHNHILNPSTDDANFILPMSTAKDKILKGTMTVSFVSYDPYAISRVILKPDGSTEKLKFINQFYDEENSKGIALVPEWKIDESSSDTSENNLNYNIYNYNEWKDSVTFKKITDYYEKDGISYLIDQPVIEKGVAFYNAGDIDTPFNLTFKFNSEQYTNRRFNSLQLMNMTNSSQTILMTGFTLHDSDYGIRYNGKLHLIEGINNKGQTTGKIYNRYITEGDFFDLEPSNGELGLIRFVYSGTDYEQLSSISIDYDYKFF